MFSPFPRARLAAIASLVCALLAIASASLASASPFGLSADPLNPSSSSINNVLLPYQPASANVPFSVPYSPNLGSGGASWQDYLTGTMQTTAPCVSFTNTAQAPGGMATTTGSLAVYQSASQAASALSAGGSVGYRMRGVASIDVSAGYSSASSQDSNSIYAVATVYTNLGTVNFGRQHLLPQYAAMAKKITNFPAATRFISQCGDAYPTGYVQGASWIAVLQIQNTSSQSTSSVYASMSGHYGGLSASANFSRTASSSTSTSSMTVTDQCNGPLQCGNAGTIAGSTYLPPGTTPTGDQPCAGQTGSALALCTFTNNYGYMMSGGLAGGCAPSANTGGSGFGIGAATCVVSVNYSPIANLAQPNPTRAVKAAATGTGSTYSPSDWLRGASYGIYGIEQNLANWSSEYQGLVTAGQNLLSDTTSRLYAAAASHQKLAAAIGGRWSQAITDLSDQAVTCSLAYVGLNQQCISRAQDCWNSVRRKADYSNRACLPSQFRSNNLRRLRNPFAISHFVQAGVAVPEQLLADVRARTCRPRVRANCSGTNLSGARLSGANLSGANFSGANLTGANLSGANLTGANLSGANLTNANFNGASIDGANLAGADANGVSAFNQVSGVVYGAGTTCTFGNAFSEYPNFSVPYATTSFNSACTDLSNFIWESILY
jgi:uncharacterized protein YjbI with pentapeptide repeats